MSEKYEPGTVAMVSTSCSGDMARAAYIGNNKWFHAEGQVGNPGQVRPLVVIDPEDPEQVENVRRVFRALDCLPGDSVDSWQSALREVIAPRPDEPTGLGSVMRSGGMHIYVRFIGGPTQLPAWANVNNLTGAKARWSDFTGSIEVLSEGVPA